MVIIIRTIIKHIIMITMIIMCVVIVQTISVYLWLVHALFVP